MNGSTASVSSPTFIKGRLDVGSNPVEALHKYNAEWRNASKMAPNLRWVDAGDKGSRPRLESGVLVRIQLLQ